MITKKTGICVLAVLLLVTLLLPACTQTDPTHTDGGISFTDALGREVTLAQKPDRVAALLGSFADTWLLAGGTVCATADDAWDYDNPALTDAVSIGGAHSPNTELLLAADPDFVLAAASTASHVSLAETLTAAGIPVAYFDVDNFEDYLAMLAVCTDITGRKDLYEANGLSVRRQIEDIKQRFADRRLPENERTVLLLRASSGSVKAKGSEGTVLGEMLADLGCINIADSDTSLLESLGAESVIRHNPYRIFVVTMGDDTQKATQNLQQMMQQNPVWATLDAVKEGRLHIMERKLFHAKPNARWAQSYEILDEIFTAQP